MANITNWEELLFYVERETKPIFMKLLARIRQTLRPYQKADDTFDMKNVQKNHMDIFNGYKVLFEQLQIETDVVDIMIEIPSLTSNHVIVFGIVSVGKWIKIHTGNAGRIFFYDDEKTVLSDKALADFLNKINDIQNKYFYFGKEPMIYYKFRIMPSEDIIAYLKSFNVISIEYDKPTPVILFPKISEDKILLDQSMILTLCSNLSYGLSNSFYEKSRNGEEKSKEFMINNKLELDTYLTGKELIVNKFVYDQTKFKIEKMAGPTELARFEKLCEKIKIVPDCQNPRFVYLKDIELQCISTAERELAMIVTSNQRMCNKIDMYYPEICYRQFVGAQLVEEKYT